jgi:hypothetical protein
LEETRTVAREDAMYDEQIEELFESGEARERAINAMADHYEEFDPE